MKRKWQMRFLSLIVILAVSFAMLFSINYISVHSNHECTGHDCRICFVIEQCSNVIKKLGTAIALSVLFGIARNNIFTEIQDGMRSVNDEYITPITLKVQMNN